MPPANNGNPAGVKRQQYSLVAKEDAIQAVSPGMSQRRAALIYGIPQQTLSDIICDRHPRSTGGQLALSEEEEIVIAENLATLGSWGFPLDFLEVRLIVKAYLEERGRVVQKFRNNIPGDDWVRGFLKRRKPIISPRTCRNICQKRATVTKQSLEAYFDNLALSLDGVSPENAINFDETCFADDPGVKKCIFRRGTKYPDRLMNSSKASTSVMFACTAAGKLLPPYVVYKAEHLHDKWIEGGNPDVRYNRSRSGWFDKTCFEDWFHSVVLPYFRRLEGPKVLIGDNLASHFSQQVITKCSEMGIRFVCIPPNTSPTCQPLDVSVFGPLKRYWKQTVAEWRSNGGRRLSTIPKQLFPRLLARMIQLTSITLKDNITNGFRKCGIFPFDRESVLCRLPVDAASVHEAVSNAVLQKLQTIHQSLQGPVIKLKKKRINVLPGKSVSADDFQQRQIVQPNGDHSECDCQFAPQDLDTDHQFLRSPETLMERISSRRSLKGQNISAALSTTCEPSSSNVEAQGISAVTVNRPSRKRNAKALRNSAVLSTCEPSSSSVAAQGNSEQPTREGAKRRLVGQRISVLPTGEQTSKKNARCCVCQDLWMDVQVEWLQCTSCTQWACETCFLSNTCANC